MQKGTALILLLAVVVVGISIYASSHKGVNLGGTTNFNALTVDSLTSSGAVTGASLTVNSGTPLLEHACATLSWDPASVSSSTAASTTITLTGAALGDPVIASFNSASSTSDWVVTGKVSAADTATIIITSVPGSATYNAGLNMVTSTARTCYFSY